MSLQEVIPNRSGVTGSEIPRNVLIPLDQVCIFSRDSFDLKAVVFKMGPPSYTTSSTGGIIDRDLRSGIGSTALNDSDDNYNKQDTQPNRYAPEPIRHFFHHTFLLKMI